MPERLSWLGLGARPDWMWFCFHSALSEVVTYKVPVHVLLAELMGHISAHEGLLLSLVCLCTFCM